MVARDQNDSASRALSGIGAEVATGEDATAHRVDGRAPKAAVFPSDLRELGRVLEMASEGGLAVAPWGGGTRTVLGNGLERLDLVVDLSRLDGILEHNPADLTATVQAGITLDDLQGALAEHGQFVALDPPLPSRATVGGSLAVGVSGPLKWQYGSPRDVVIGMKVAQADGRVTKSGGQVVKNVSGYDMSRLHIGGLGTLGVIAEVSFKLTPLPASQSSLVAAYDATQRCVEAGLSVFHSDVLPLALSTFDSTAEGRMSSIDIDGSRFLAVRLGGRPRTLERQIRECRSIFADHGPSQVELLSEAEARSIWRGVADFGWDEATTPMLGARASVPPSKVPKLIRALERPDNAEGLLPAVVSHPAHGSVLVCWYATDVQPSTDALSSVLRRAREAAHEAGGHLTIEQCPPEVKSGLDVWDDVGEPLAIMRRLKEHYDPKRTLNPGRFVGGI